MNKVTFITFLVFISATLVACTGCQPTPATNNLNTNSSNTNTVTKPANAVAGPAGGTSVGSLATPTDSYKTAYELRRKRDVEGLKKVMAPDALEFLTMMGEPEKSLEDMLREMCDKPQADKVATRNEKISGNLATIEYLTETGSWKVMDFQKIGGEWKIGFPKLDKEYDEAAKNH